MVGLRPNIIIKSAAQLDAADRKAWQAMPAQNPALYSPYFHIEYTELVASLRGDVRILCAYEKDTPIAFLPHQGTHFARPVGAPMTDYQGFICAPETTLDVASLLKQAGIGCYHFSAGVNKALADYLRDEDSGVMLDISVGAEAWRAARDSSYRRHLKSNRRRARKATEDIGEIRCEWSSHDKAVFDQLIDWKSQKFVDTGKYNVLSAGWTLDMIQQLWAQPDANLRADMHVLYMKDRVAAIDLGLTDGTTFHSWIVAYDGDLHSYAPGIQLLEKLVDASAKLGYSRIDLGAGTDGYKRHYASEDVLIGGGFIGAQGPAAALSQIYAKAERFGEKSLKDAPGKLRRRYSQIAACEDSFSGRAKAMVNAVRVQGRS